MPNGCIFCGGLPLTVEDVLPKWMQPILADRHPVGRDGKRLQLRGGLFEARTRTHLWPAKTPKILLRDVCEPCNTGWMSLIEQAAKPIITPMIRGELVSITAEDRYTLARWIGLKSVLTYQARSGWEFSEKWVRSFYEQREELPQHWKFRIGRVSNMSNVYFGSARLNYEIRHQLSPFVLRPVGFLGTLIAGEFIGQVIGIETSAVNVPIDLDHYLPVWPMPEIDACDRELVDAERLAWPPKRSLSLRQAVRATGDPEEPRR